MSTVFKKYNLKITSHILIQCVNNLTAMIVIQRKHDIMKNEKYSVTAYNATIIYFKTLMKHLNVREKISIVKMMLFNSYFNE